MEGVKTKLSSLWIFASLNYIYADLVGLMDANYLKGYLAGRVSGIEVTQSFLLFATILVEIPMAMVLLSRILGYRPNRWANVIAGAIMTVVQAGTLFIGTPTVYYVFFSVVEIGATAVIVWLAWTWAAPRESVTVAAEAAV